MIATMMLPWLIMHGIHSTADFYTAFHRYEALVESRESPKLCSAYAMTYNEAAQRLPEDLRIIEVGDELPASLDAGACR